ncbi:uncharacterized protein PHACADRAFT_132088 [Phanerochaete carnosa HHB-10118-sp]|uniref:Rad21/Rec8-like protein N-terminal domain-containing protein n=1 Tax=Phanerochaete carnosa (strain HHB-10118-sp) TaxID=650164 RepID=K5VCW0_PHACS|nr:uncharacterized protein PHACADRAFT_132088 [Phanerochaete carnosa HHB-10118-sp]EKM48928.1 hypothetical protein PHACADRAFT_132088 [Phanerochaete carnosa HHB-10118-sp]
MERKLSKTQTLQTDIEQSVDAIVGQEVEVMALRLSGQLLLGVVRIYSRKAKYLLDDCNEALLKIKMAFRPGVVDMTEDQLVVNRNAITLQTNALDLDALLPDVNWDIDFQQRPIQPAGQHIARSADITLAAADDFQFNFDGPGFDDLDPQAIGSQDFEELELDLDFGDGVMGVRGRSVARASSEGAESMEIEYGRDAAPPRHPRESLGSHLMGRHGAEEMDVDAPSYRSRELSLHPFDDDDLGLLGGEDINLEDLAIGFDVPPPELEQVPALSPSRACTSHLPASPLTEPPKTPPADVELAPQVEAEAAKVQRKPRVQRQIFDERIELEGGPGSQAARRRGAELGFQRPDVSGITTEHGFLPRSSLLMRLLEIRDDPVAHFLPIRNTPAGTFFCAAPPGMAPELQDLFMRPLQALSGPKRRGSPEAPRGEKPPSKRPRLEGAPAPGDDEEPEQGRRDASVAPSAALGSDILGGRVPSDRGDLDFGDQSGLAGEDFEMQVPEFVAAADETLERARSVLSELSRLSSPAPTDAPLDEGGEGARAFADAACPIATFDDRSAQGQEQADRAEDGRGYSKNTIKALRLVRQELQPEPRAREEKVVSFNAMAQGASRRAASAFFFELLVLGTRDCVRLAQEASYANIEARAGDKLWERQRHTSAVPSVSSALRPAGSSQREPSLAPSAASDL